MGRASLKKIAAASHADIADLAANAVKATSANGIREGTPVNAEAASLTTALGVADAELTYTAVTKGVDGATIEIEYVNPAANNAALTVSVAGTVITVSLATDGAGAITTTAADITAAIAIDAEANALVGAANAADNNGTGIVTAMAQTSLAGGVDGTAGAKGEVYQDTGYLYVCTVDNTINDSNWERSAIITY